MPGPYDQQIEDLLDQYRRQRDEAAETRRRINETTSTVTAPRQTVKITVGAQGEVTAIEFPTGAYRRMAPKELADVLLTTLRQARAEALERVAGVLADRLPPGVTVPDLLQGRVDPAAVLPADPAMPDSVRDYVDHGFKGGPDE
ncbi:YbaB/EbfC family nucleoid-associated protein [Streptomyces sp. NPDC126522]|uniref:YbaB/EbfC family nucleoid-associated protein n=1 Tax=Streptomyces sp. NPDC126522 TaxID=3155211 RepID=UPI00331AFC00